ncbi:MAG: hypothetical protein M1500_00865 [Candidatus Marsarchaeota archaeon]|nr:hypothetical protein [Candidatus Marsarchaeota archaeon]
MDSSNSANRFLVVADRRMLDSAVAELHSSFDDLSHIVVCSDSTIAVMSVKSSKMGASQINKVSKALTFSYIVFHEWMVIDSPYDKDRIVESIKGLLDGKLNPTFMLEAKIVEANLGMNAKSVEVEVGMAVEDGGFRPSLTAPDMYIYLIISADKTAIGYSGVIEYPGPIDPFRIANAGPNDELNRAELKFKEAVNFFDIDVFKWRVAIDIGAAPGGWTAALSGMMCKVVAVDSALLDYDNTFARKTLIIYGKGDDSLGSYQGRKGIETVEFNEDMLPLVNYLNEYDVVHLKANIGSPTKNFDEYLLQLKDADALVIDSNMAPEKNAEMAVRLKSTLKAGATLVMTIKLFDANIQGHIEDVKRALAGSYSGIMLKKLHYNRMELTLVAAKA